ncbi:hypothetical protein D3C77_608920 [compost metagenome]
MQFPFQLLRVELGKDAVAGAMGAETHQAGGLQGAHLLPVEGMGLGIRRTAVGQGLQGAARQPLEALQEQAQGGAARQWVAGVENGRWG